MLKTLCFLAFSALIVALLIDVCAFAIGWKNYPLIPVQVRIVSGPHIGRCGNIVSIPWIGNGYNLRASINVPGKDDRREWVDVWSWQIEH